jgi:hypothetical protein
MTEVKLDSKWKPKLSHRNWYGEDSVYTVLHIHSYPSRQGFDKRSVFLAVFSPSEGHGTNRMLVDDLLDQFEEIEPFFEKDKSYKFKTGSGRTYLVREIVESVDRSTRRAVAEYKNYSGKVDLTILDAGEFIDMEEVDVP